MKRGTIWTVLICLIVISILLTSCNTSTTSKSTSTAPATTTTAAFPTTSSTPLTIISTTPTSTKPTTTSIAGNWWDSLGNPQYGGSFSYRLNADIQGLDAYVANFTAPWDIFQDTLGGINWTASPDQWNYEGKWSPDDIKAGDLVQSWEISGALTTYTFKLRQGVHFALDPNSAASQLVAGRELTSADVVYSFDRFYGLAGYKASLYKDTSLASIASVTAPDKYTVVFTFGVPSPWYFGTIMDPESTNVIVPHEVIEKYGDMNNWHNLVGSGPYMLEDYVPGASGTWVKNPNYWGYDERYPQNHLPYIDKINYLIIPSDQTALAGLRTGKLDIVEGLDWSTAATVEKANPQLLQETRASTGYGLDYRNDKAPFTDIRVRQAMQEAIDLPTIAKSYYGGNVPGVPVGAVTTSWTGWYVPYAQWPQSLQAEYNYNPTAAKQLLAAAGYPNGFNTDVNAPSNYDVDLLQIYKSYLAAIGINMTINVTDYTTWINSYLIGGKQDQILYNQSIGYLQPPIRLIAHFYSKSQISSNPFFVKDPAFDAIYNQFIVASDTTQQKALMQQADMYGITNFFQLNALPTVEYVLYQPWFKGYQGQLFYFWAKISFGRYWINQSLKQSKGY